MDLLCSILAEMSKMSRELYKPHRLSLTITSRETGSIFFAAREDICLELLQDTCTQIKSMLLS